MTGLISDPHVDVFCDDAVRADHLLAITVIRFVFISPIELLKDRRGRAAGRRAGAELDVLNRASFTGYLDADLKRRSRRGPVNCISLFGNPATPLTLDGPIDSRND
jgi:hypothetical protein